MVSEHVKFYLIATWPICTRCRSFLPNICRFRSLAVTEWLKQEMNAVTHSSFTYRTGICHQDAAGMSCEKQRCSLYAPAPVYIVQTMRLIKETEKEQNIPTYRDVQPSWCNRAFWPRVRQKHGSVSRWLSYKMMRRLLRPPLRGATVDIRPNSSTSEDKFVYLFIYFAPRNGPVLFVELFFLATNPLRRLQAAQRQSGKVKKRKN